MCKMLVRRAVLSFLLTVAVAGSAFAEDLVPAPLDLGKDVTAYAVIPDPSALLTTLDAIAKTILPPQAYAPGMLKTLIGTQLQDPALTNLGTKPAVFMIFKLPEGYNPQAGPPPLAIYFPAVAAAPYDQVLGQNSVTAFEDGVLMVSPTPDGLKAAQQGRAIYNKIAAAKIPTEARVYISGAALMERFGNMLKGAAPQAEEAIAGQILSNAPPNLQMKPEQVMKYTKLFSRGLIGFLNQLDAIQLDLKIKPDAIGIEHTLIAKSGTILAEALSAPAPKWDKNLEALAGKGANSGMSNIDMTAIAAAWKKIVAEMNADAELSDLAKDEAIQWITDGLESSSGSSAFSMNFDQDGFSVRQAGGVKDEKKYFAMQEKMASMFDKDSIFAKLYAGLGMKWDAKLEKNARERKGVQIGRMTITIDSPMFNDQQRAQFKKMMRPTEMAAVKNYYIGSNNPEATDTMIDTIMSGDFSPTGFTVKAKQVFGEGRQFYFDYDVVNLMKATAGADPNNPLGPMFAKLEGGAPILIALSMDKGKLFGQTSIPLDPMVKMVKTFQEGIQALQNGPVKPKPVEDGKF